MKPMPETISSFVARSDPRRLQSETVTLTLELENGTHTLDVSLAYGADGLLRELVFVGRGRIGLGMDAMLHDLGIRISRILQRRNPDTGEGA